MTGGAINLGVHQVGGWRLSWGRVGLLIPDLKHTHCLSEPHVCPELWACIVFCRLFISGLRATVHADRPARHVLALCHSHQLSLLWGGGSL